MNKRIILVILWVLTLSPLASAGTLRVKTDSAGAEVLLDGKSVGKTPLAVTDVTPGTHSLRLVKEGFSEATRSVEIPPEGPAISLFVVLAAPERSLPALPVTFTALHQHKAGMCSGTLTVDADGVKYKAEDGVDVFSLPWSAMKTVTRGMGGLPNIQWALTGEYCGLRIDAADRNYGFFAYDESPSLPRTAPGKRGDVVTFEMTSQRTGELFDLVYRLWLPQFKARRLGTPAP